MSEDITVGRIKIGNQGSSHTNGHSMEVQNLTTDENDHLKGALTHGSSWVRVDRDDGRLITHPVFKAFPDPIEDEEMHPYWCAPAEGEAVKDGKIESFEFDHLNSFSSPSFSISHLCGYNYTAEGYKEQARKLKSFGFSVMRSQRGKDGKYWEMWFLPGGWAAKGDLKREFTRLDQDKQMPPKDKHSAIVHYLCRQVQFGTLDMCMQRAAMTFDG